MLLVRIHQQYARVGMNIKEPALNLHTQHPQITMQTEPARLEMVSPRPVLHIDQRQCFADANMRSPEAFKDYMASLARQAAIEAIGQIASEGDSFADFKHNTVGSIAAANSVHQHEFEVKAIPQQPPEISFDISPVQVSYQPSSVELNLQRGFVDPKLDWGQVNVYLQQKNFVQFHFAGNIVSAVA